jgi:hypothetical protein
MNHDALNEDWWQAVDCETGLDIVPPVTAGGCKKFKQGEGAVFSPDECYYGLNCAPEDKCYSYNPSQGLQYRHMESCATNTWWWSEVSCETGRKQNTCNFTASNTAFKSNGNNDWEYIGEATNSVSQSNSSHHLKGFVDALGRFAAYTQETLKQLSRGYYVQKQAGHTAYSQTDYQWKKEMETSNGTLQVFRQEYKAQHTTKDSLVYPNGEWEVTEKDSIARQMRFKNSVGAIHIQTYDEKWRLIEVSLQDGQGATLLSEYYVWQNGRLAQMTRNDTVRNYFYDGDTVHVAPTDSGLNFHPGYDGTVGKMPMEGEVGYNLFVLNPYGFSFKAQSKAGSSNTRKILAKQYIDEINGLPRITYNNPLRDTCHYHVCPLDRAPDGGFAQAHGKTQFSIALSNQDAKKLQCVEDNGCFKITNDVKFYPVSIEILQSTLMLSPETGKLARYCRTKNSLQDTYNHEVQHIQNVENKTRQLVDTYIPATFFGTKKECEVERDEAEYNLLINLKQWFDLEMKHQNIESPQPTNYKEEYLCDEIY